MTHPANEVKAELARYREVAAVLSSEDLDEQTLLDTLEGATDLHECLLALDEANIEDEILLEGLSAKIAQLDARRSRIKQAIESRRGLILVCMENAELQQVKGPCATISVRKTPPALQITDEAAIPSAYWKAQDPKLDKKAVKEALDRKEAVPGAALDNGGVSLTIRRR